LKQDEDANILKKKFDHADDVVEAARRRLKEKFELKKYKAHEDNEFYNKLTQLKNVVTVITKPGFAPSQSGLTHLLFLKKWEFWEENIT